MTLSKNELQENDKERSHKVRISKEPDERRQEIIETALKIFSEKGYENTAIQDIANEMKVSPGLCYRYFKSKTEIFAAASKYYAIKAVEEMKIPIPKDMPADEKLNIVMNRIFNFSTNNYEFEARFNEVSSIRAIILDDVATEFIAIMVPIIEQGIKENIFHCSNAARTARFLISGLTHTFHEEMPEENVKEYMTDFIDFIHEIQPRVLGMKL